jgi:hypothetical protein
VRALLLEAVSGGAEAILPALGALASFRALAALWQAGWLGSGKISPRAASAEIRQRLRAIAATRRSLAEAATVPAGTPVLVEGTLVAPFTLDDGSGERAELAGVRWIDGRAPAQGDRVTVLGFVERALDPSRPPPGPRQLATRLVLRSAALPLLGQTAQRAPGKARRRTIT